MALRIAVVDRGTDARRETLHAIGQSTEFTVVGQGSTVVDAVDIIRSLNPHILLLGLGLRNQGLRTLWETVGSGFNTKVVVLSSSADVGDVLTAIRCGASGYILRSSAAKLTETLLHIHESGVYISPELGARVLLDIAQSRKTATTPKSDWSTERGRQLSDREREIVSLVRQGCQNKEIASRLELHEGTVKQHLSSVFRKLQVRSRAELAALV